MIQQRPAFIITGAPRAAAPPGRRPALFRVSSGSGGATVDLDSAYARMVMARRQLQIAVVEEDYALAAQLRDKISALEEELPTVKHFLLGTLDRLHGGDARERVVAIQALGELGDYDALPHLQALLCDATLGSMAEEAMWQIFMRAPTSEAKAKFERGIRLMHETPTLRAAAVVFSELIEEFPDFAEAYNKRATTFYLLGRHAEAIEDCKATVALLPWHFGALSGMGMCCAALEDYAAAIAAFEGAVRVNPRMAHLEHHIMQLRAHQEEQNEP